MSDTISIYKGDNHRECDIDEAKKSFAQYLQTENLNFLIGCGSVNCTYVVIYTVIQFRYYFIGINRNDSANTAGTHYLSSDKDSNSFIAATPSVSSISSWMDSSISGISSLTKFLK